MTSHDCPTRPSSQRPGRGGEAGQAMTEWLLWAAVMTVLATMFVSVALPVVAKVPAALAGWLASVGP